MIERLNTVFRISLSLNPGLAQRSVELDRSPSSSATGFAF
jgi:hypothetical protein